MNESLVVGLENTRKIEVDEMRTISFMGEDSRVYSTPFVLHDVEVASHQLLSEYMDEDEVTVGISATINHMAATPLGMWVEIKVHIVGIDGRKIDLEFECKDAGDIIAKGKHSRFIVNKEKTAAQIKAKAGQYL